MSEEAQVENSSKQMFIILFLIHDFVLFNLRAPE